MTQHLGGRRISRKRKLGLHTSRLYWKILCGAVPVFCLAFMATFMASSICAPINMSNAVETQVNAIITQGSYSVSLTVTPNVNLSLTAYPTGTMSTGVATVSAQTNAPGGYKIYMGMNDDENSLILDANHKITSTGTFTNPLALGNGKWGYAIPHSDPTVISTNGFETTYTVESNVEPGSNSMTFASLPTNEQPAQLVAQTSTSNYGNPNTFSVYYGVQADHSVAEGTYTNSVLYTAVADGGTTSEINLTPNETPNLTGSGQTIKVTTPLYLAPSTTTQVDIYMLSQSEYDALAANSISLNSLASKKMTCTTTGEAYLEYNCTAPANEIGQYQVYVNIPEYSQSFHKQFDYIATFYNITTMQQMTHAICNDSRYVATPSADVYYDATDTAHHAATKAANGNPGNGKGEPTYPVTDTTRVPYTTLTDTRMGVTNTYEVRKLADGNCWMVNNLNLEFDGSNTLTPDNTNMPAGTAAKTPSESQSRSAATTTAEEDAWKEPSAGANSDRWLSRSTRNAQESSAGGNITGENQKIGVYYNWYTAVAGSVTQSQGATTAPMDICPKGWQLPRYTGNGSWMWLIKDTYSLISTSGDQGSTRANDILHKFPFSLPYSGLVYRESGATVYQGTYGYWWSAGSNSSTHARHLYISGSYTYPEVDNYKTYGWSVRCVAQ